MEDVYVKRAREVVGSFNNDGVQLVDRIAQALREVEKGAESIGGLIWKLGYRRKK